ncbi:MAG: DUF58 domain-containing protein [Phycisphaerales bacterium]
MLVSSVPTRPTSLEQLISTELCARLDRIDILSRKIFAGKLHGERRSKRRGQSVEFEDYRNYVPGDDLRHVDWNIFARLEKFFIKIFQEEEDLSVHIVLDATASMDSPAPPRASKLALAMRLAMALAYIAIVNNDRVSVSIFDGRSMARLGPLRGRRHVQRVGAFLLTQTQPAGVSPATSTTDRDPPDTIETFPNDPAPVGSPAGLSKGDFTGCLRTIAASRSGKGVMIVLSDFLIPGGYQDGLRMLAGGGIAGAYDTYCLQILSPGELDPSAERTQTRPGNDDQRQSPGSDLVGDMRLVDAETGRATEVTLTADVIRVYRKAVNAYVEELKAFCLARDISHGLIRSDADVESLLLDYLRKRGLLR